MENFLIYESYKIKQMKKCIILVLVFAMSIIGFAQTALTTAVDFTVNTVDNQEFNLFEKLNNGQYVCIDFFSTT